MPKHSLELEKEQILSRAARNSANMKSYLTRINRSSSMVTTSLFSKGEGELSEQRTAPRGPQSSCWLQRVTFFSIYMDPHSKADSVHQPWHASWPSWVSPPGCEWAEKKKMIKSHLFPQVQIVCHQSGIQS